MPYLLVGCNQYFGRTYCLRLQGTNKFPEDGCIRDLRKFNHHPPKNFAVRSYKNLGVLYNRCPARIFGFWLHLFNLPHYLVSVYCVLEKLWFSDNTVQNESVFLSGTSSYRITLFQACAEFTCWRAFSNGGNRMQTSLWRCISILLQLGTYESLPTLVARRWTNVPVWVASSTVGSVMIWNALGLWRCCIADCYASSDWTGHRSAVT
jgi:hypothetical protein